MLVLSFAFPPLIFARMMPTFDLGASAFFVFMQDAVLEPFGGDLFGLAMGKPPVSMPSGAPAYSLG